jgi:hypothetical protein
MKSLGIYLCALLAGSVHAATSDILFATGGTHMTGSTVTNSGSMGVPGNLVFDGSRFVFPTVSPSGAIHLNFLATNGALVASNALPISGAAPRVIVLGTNYLIAWLDTNAATTPLHAALFSNGSLGNTFLIATNVSAESIALSGRQSTIIAVWQSGGAVLARALNEDGSAAGGTFAVASSAEPQRFPAIDTDGANHLVCWMEQNGATNQWRVLARVIANGQPAGNASVVSQTNSAAPFPTACSFGTNYLVLWSVDNGLYPFPSYYYWPGWTETNVHYAMVDGRMVTFAGEPAGDSFAVIRARGMHTNVAVAFASGRYLVGAIAGAIPVSSNLSHTFSALLQPLAANGARVQHPIIATRYSLPAPERLLASGAGRICELEWEKSGTSEQRLRTVIYTPQFRSELRITNLQRTNGGISAVGISGTEYTTNVMYWSAAEYTTNFVNWTTIYLQQLPTLTNHPKLLVRLKDASWPCMENLRAIDGAKHHWALETKRTNIDVPTASDLFGPARYIPQAPVCPNGGAYTLQSLSSKPTCTLGGHTI